MSTVQSSSPAKSIADRIDGEVSHLIEAQAVVDLVAAALDGISGDEDSSTLAEESAKHACALRVAMERMHQIAERLEYIRNDSKGAAASREPLFDADLDAAIRELTAEQRAGIANVIWKALYRSLPVAAPTKRRARRKAPTLRLVSVSTPPEEPGAA
jgi:hypothetical protein